LSDKEQMRRWSFLQSKVTLLAFLVTVGAVVVAIYAFQQKRKADEQTSLAEQRAKEAMQQQRMALEQRNIADSNKEQAIQQRELAFENERTALTQKEIADSQTRIAKKSEAEALLQQQLAEEQKIRAEKQKEIAEANAAEVIRQQEIASKEKAIAKEQTQTSNKLKELIDSRSIANESLLLLNENLVDSSRHKALYAYQLNKTNKGLRQNNDIYNALNSNWAKSIDDKNQSRIHTQPVRCITGMPDRNIIFTADESGILYESSIKNNSLQRVAFFSGKEEIRALAVSPDGTKLVAITFAGNGFIFNISANSISTSGSFKLQGIGKAVTFNDAGYFIVLSNKGMAKYQLSNLSAPVFFDKEGISAFTTGKNGKLYIASGNQVNIYNQWDDLTKGNVLMNMKYDSKVTSIAVDAYEQYIATGTNNGFIWLSNLKTGNVLWNRALHLSSVNDLKFAIIDNNIIQLASAGADQTIKLIDVKGILQNSQEDIITLKGHTKWIYALYYTPDGEWLFSTGGDSKVIAWKPSMADLYQTLSSK